MSADRKGEKTVAHLGVGVAVFYQSFSNFLNSPKIGYRTAVGLIRGTNKRSEMYDPFFGSCTAYNKLPNWNSAVINY